VPFFPQKLHQCGPAALATVLANRGLPVTADDLVGQVYLPGREGSLQVEMVATVRRHGFVPYPIDGRLDEVIDEIAAGRPVLVLQNLGVSWYPVWHYAVVVGVDVDRDELITRSGTIERRREGRTIFMRTWARSGFWGRSALAPGELPAREDPAKLFRALAEMEAVGRRDVALAGYRAMVERWNAADGYFGLGNLALADQDWSAAERDFRAAIARADGRHPAAQNNLAMALLGRGCASEALDEADTALAQLAPEDPLSEVVGDTARQARERLASGEACR
jgi:peptidase C39-like protein